MYHNILVMLDNSDYSLWAVDRSIELARVSGGKLVGAHVYAARLHEDRFIQMEPGLPERYQAPEALQEQRTIHGELIEKGLKIISDSYLDVFRARCEKEGIPCDGKTMEGKNYAELVKDIRSTGYDLVAMGAKGLGEVPSAPIGSVCERVARRVQVDALIMKKPLALHGGHVVVCVDGSEQSFAAMQAAVAMAKRLGCHISALSVFDPDFHYKAFHSISKVLSKEAGEAFRFEQQEKLHEEIIDSGLEKIYRDHLKRAEQMAEREGVAVDAHVLAGKPYDQILKWIEGKEIALLLLGRVGAHSDEMLDIGSTTENLLRFAQCNIMLVSRRVKPEAEQAEPLTPMEWEEEAVAMLNRAPAFVRNMIRGHMESMARREGMPRVTVDMMRRAREKMGM
ncbi:MAG: universal stress protein [Nitrospinae bacterium]|nr:universal stress protein [Nitrospinota bacterium]